MLADVRNVALNKTYFHADGERVFPGTHWTESFIAQIGPAPLARCSSQYRIASASYSVLLVRKSIRISCRFSEHISFPFLCTPIIKRSQLSLSPNPIAFRVEIPHLELPEPCYVKGYPLPQSWTTDLGHRPSQDVSWMFWNLTGRPSPSVPLKYTHPKEVLSVSPSNKEVPREMISFFF
jgi:hypothetical protein